MESFEFPKDLALMHGMLEKLEVVSLRLHEQFSTKRRVDKMIKIRVRVNE
jgi:hypothetical protein